MFEELPATSAAFYSAILIQSIAALKLNTYLDNFDAARFNLDGADHSKEFAAGERAYFFDWFFKHHESLFAAYSLLSDLTSKRLYLHLIAYRLAGHFSVRLPVDLAGAAARNTEYAACERSEPSSLAASGLFGRLRHFDFLYRGGRYLVDCLGLGHYLVLGQYRYLRDGVSIAPAAGDTVIDGGACTGETAAVFSVAAGPTGRVVCFDPVADHLSILQHNALQAPLANITVLPFGLSDHDVDAPPVVLNQYAPGFSAGRQTVPLRSIDSLVDSGTLSGIGFIKLDVEGAELASLRGARVSIDRFKPRLAVSLYHKPDDLFEIILQLRRDHPFYSLHIDHYTIHGEETVLYCRPG